MTIMRSVTSALRGTVSVSEDVDTGRKWVWAGRADAEPIPGDGTAECRELARRGILHSHEVEDGYHVWEVDAAWVDAIR